MMVDGGGGSTYAVKLHNAQCTILGSYNTHDLGVRDFDNNLGQTQLREGITDQVPQRRDSASPLLHPDCSFSCSIPSRLDFVLILTAENLPRLKRCLIG